jgi:hypothetical protein
LSQNGSFFGFLLYLLGFTRKLGRYLFRSIATGIGFRILMADAKRGIDKKLGHILVQALLLENNGQKITQGVIKRDLAKREGAPPISNMDHPLGYLVEGRNPKHTILRPQTGRAWLRPNGRPLSFFDRDCVLADHRACAGLLFALSISAYRRAYHSFSTPEVAKYLKDEFGVDAKLFKLFLEDFRKCGYTARSEIENEEQIRLNIVNGEICYIRAAAATPALVKDYSRSGAE